MLCRFCQSIDLDLAASESGAPHHASYADLIASAEEGCELCRHIHEADLAGQTQTRGAYKRNILTDYPVTYRNWLNYLDWRVEPGGVPAIQFSMWTTGG